MHRIFGLTLFTLVLVTIPIYGLYEVSIMVLQNRAKSNKPEEY